MKVATWKGCKDCPYNQWDSNSGYSCENPNMEPIYFDRDGIEIPETPHENCKLPDLPSMEFAVNTAMLQSNYMHKLKSVEFGANYVLNKIKQ
jgi:hypothetical protein